MFLTKVRCVGLSAVQCSSCNDEGCCRGRLGRRLVFAVFLKVNGAGGVLSIPIFSSSLLNLSIRDIDSVKRLSH